MSNLVLGIDIGGTNTGFALVDEFGKIQFKENVPTYNYPEITDLAKDIFRIISFATEKNQQLSMPLSIGVGAPNGNFFKGTIDFAPNLKWDGVIDVRSAFEKYFKVPSSVNNDANAAALGEHRFGNAKGMNDFVIVTLGTGLGSGFFVNGKLMYGHHSYGGEMGHIIMEENGRPCGCGRFGCLECYASVTGLKRNLLELISKGFSSELSDFKMEDLSGKIIEEAAGRGDVASLEAFEMAGSFLGKAMANVAAITDPEAFILFGGLAQAKELIFKPAIFHMEQNLLEIFKGKIKVLPSALSGNNAALLGAAAIAWDSIN